MTQRVGFGFDVHRFVDDAERPLVLGGVVFDSPMALSGHSDADVVTHAITDAVLGAAAMGDMGEHFPDTDAQWAGADSIAMLEATVELVHAAGYQVVNVDCTVVTETPKIAPRRADMQMRLSDVIGAPVSVKAGRAEGLGAIGRIEGAACWAVAMLERS